MENTVIHRHAESWYRWPQDFVVPKGWLYRTENTGWVMATCDTTVQLFCTGDWLEMVQLAGRHTIRHEIT